MGMRTMSRWVRGTCVYASQFDQDTGTVIRILPDIEDPVVRMAMFAEEGLRRDSSDLPSGVARHHRLQSSDGQVADIPAAVAPHSPSPETIDVCVTQLCGFGCEFCYQDSLPTTPIHAPMSLIEAILTGFDQKPYQIAYGGGSPTSHPEFETILRLTRESDIVPNYTTEGLHLGESMVKATNDYCGGVSMTFHGWKGFDWFDRQYRKFDERISVQKNIHLIVDLNVTENLQHLIELQSKMKKALRVILLAYYPGVGRSGYELLPTKQILDIELPAKIQLALAEGMSIAFSEGLLPYFLSRPDILPINSASVAEGKYSCYISEWGQMYKSSFNQHPKPSFGCVHNNIETILPEEMIEYVASAIAGRRTFWEREDGSYYTSRQPDEAQDVIKAIIENPRQTRFNVSLQKQWLEIADDYTNMSGAYDQHNTFGCSYCQYEHACSKDKTHDVHIMMCANHRG